MCLWCVTKSDRFNGTFGRVEMSVILRFATFAYLLVVASRVMLGDRILPLCFERNCEYSENNGCCCHPCIERGVAFSKLLFEREKEAMRGI